MAHDFKKTFFLALNCAIIHGVKEQKHILISHGVHSMWNWSLSYALGIGIVVGGVAVGFVYLIEWMQQLFWELLLPHLGLPAPYNGMLLPVIGAGVAWVVTRVMVGEVGGHGVPEVMAGVLFRGGHVDARTPLVRGTLAAVTMGSGLSVGPEGPIVQIGAALGSLLGRVLRVNHARLRTLVAGGAAAGIAVIFNAPLAGVFFALEALLMELRLESLADVVIAATTASVIGHVFLGDHPAFGVPHFRLVHPLELGFYILLGLLAVPVGIGLIRGLSAVEDGLRRFNLPAWGKPLTGAFFVGVLGAAFPPVLGSGHRVIEQLLYLQLPWRVVVLLIPFKLLATALSIGSGNPGGIFAPSLVLGAALGGALGYGVHTLWPSLTAAPFAYALVGMAAVLTVTVRAPIAALFLIFEMTRDYALILPLMTSTVVALVMAQVLEPESIYTLALKREGIDVRVGRDFDVMRGIWVRDAMTPFEVMARVTPDTLLPELVQLLAQTHHHGLPVVNADGTLYGIVTLQDVEAALRCGHTQIRAGDIASREVRVTFPDETLADALRHFAEHDIGRVPVVERQPPHQLIGMLRRADIVRAYALAAHDVHYRQHVAEHRFWGKAAPMEMVRFVLKEKDMACGKYLHQLRLPAQALIAAIERGHETLIPRGDTLLLPGDVCWVLLHADDAQTVARYLRQGEA